MPNQLREYVYRSFGEILNNYRQQFPQHVNYIENEINNGRIDLNILVRSIGNSNRVIDGNGKIDFNTLGMLVNEKIQNLLNMIQQRASMQNSMSMNHQPMSMGMGGMISSPPISTFGSDPFHNNSAPNINTDSSPFGIERNAPRDNEKSSNANNNFESSFAQEDEAIPVLIKEEDISKLNLMEEDNLFRKAFDIQSIYIDNDRDLPSIIEAVSRNHICYLDDIIDQFNICYVNGLMQNVYGGKGSMFRIEFDNINLTGKTKEALKLFDKIDDAIKSCPEYEDGLDDIGTLGKINKIIEAILEIKEYGTTNNAYVFNDFAINKFNNLFSKYFRRNPSHVNENEYEYFDTYPKINRIFEILNDRVLINDLIESEYFTDEAYLSKVLLDMKKEFIYDFICRKDYMHVSAYKDLEYILFNNSLPFSSIIKEDDKYKLTEKIKKIRKLNPPDSEIVDKDAQEELEELYNKVLGEKTIILKERKRVIFKHDLGVEGRELFQIDSEWLSQHGQIKGEYAIVDTFFSDIDYLVGIRKNKNDVEYCIYEVFHILDGGYIFKYVNSKILNKDQALIHFEI